MVLRQVRKGGTESLAGESNRGPIILVEIWEFNEKRCLKLAVVTSRSPI